MMRKFLPWMIGGGLLLSKNNLIEGYEGGLLFKNKKDQIFQLKIVNTQQVNMISTGAYFKFKF